MCRADAYEVRIIYDGAEIHRHSLATRIQAWWRGCLARARYCAVREHHQPRDPMVARHAAARALGQATAKLTKAQEEQADAVNMLLAQTDHTMLHVRALVAVVAKTTMRPIGSLQWEEIKGKASARMKGDCPICLCALQMPTRLCVLLRFLLKEGWS